MRFVCVLVKHIWLPVTLEIEDNTFPVETALFFTSLHLNKLFRPVDYGNDLSVRAISVHPL